MEKDKLKIYNLIILDKSGSMSSIADAAISGFNETVGGIRSAQKRYQETQQHYVSLFVFCDCDKHYVYENVPVDAVKTLTSKEYRPCCCTPLFDAMGISLNKLLSQIQHDGKATAVVTVITDGLENASCEYSGSDIKALVDKLKEKEGWNFAYIGTNQDVDAVAASISIDNTMYFQDDSEGMSTAWSNERKSKMRMFDRIDSDVCYCMHMSYDDDEAKSFRARRNREEKNYRHLSEFQDRITPDNIDSLKDNEIFVFGSNSNGEQISGSSKVAVEKFGAVKEQGEGLHGKSYALPIADGAFGTIFGTGFVEDHVKEFILFARNHPELTFLVTRLGYDNADFTDEDIAPFFVSAINIPNIHLPLSFWKELVDDDVDFFNNLVNEDENAL